MPKAKVLVDPDRKETPSAGTTVTTKKPDPKSKSVKKKSLSDDPGPKQPKKVKKSSSDDDLYRLPDPVPVKTKKPKKKKKVEVKVIDGVSDDNNNFDFHRLKQCISSGKGSVETRPVILSNTHIGYRVGTSSSNVTKVGQRKGTHSHSIERGADVKIAKTAEDGFESDDSDRTIAAVDGAGSTPPLGTKHSLLSAQGTSPIGAPSSDHPSSVATSTATAHLGPVPSSAEETPVKVTHKTVTRPGSKRSKPLPPSEVLSPLVQNKCPVRNHLNIRISSIVAKRTKKSNSEKEVLVQWHPKVLKDEWVEYGRLQHLMQFGKCVSLKQIPPDMWPEVEKFIF